MFAQSNQINGQFVTTTKVTLNNETVYIYDKTNHKNSSTFDDSV